MSSEGLTNLAMVSNNIEFDERSKSNLSNFSVTHLYYCFLKLFVTCLLEIVATAVHLGQSMRVTKYKFAFAFCAQHSHFFLASKAFLSIFLKVFRLLHFGKLNLVRYAHLHEVFLEFKCLAFLFFDNVSFSNL